MINFLSYGYETKNEHVYGRQCFYTMLYKSQVLENIILKNTISKHI